MGLTGFRVKSICSLDLEGDTGMKTRQKEWISALFYSPAVLVFTVFVGIPAIMEFVYSFTDWNGYSPKVHFVGFDNFALMFNDGRFSDSIQRTVIFTLLIVVLDNILALALALALDRIVKLKGLMRAGFFLPQVMSTVAIGYAWSYMYQPIYGVINTILKFIGLASVQPDWLGNLALVNFSVAGVKIWQDVGFFMVIYLAGLQTISRDVIEAADIDGANFRQKFCNITFPLLASSFTICLTLSTISALKMFDQIKILTDGGPGVSSENALFYVYWLGFLANRQGYGTAVALVLFLFIMLVTLIQVTLLRKREVEIE